MLPSLEKCLDDVQGLETFFKRKKDMIQQLYGEYCRNYLKTEQILNEFDSYFDVSISCNFCE